MKFTFLFAGVAALAAPLAAQAQAAPLSAVRYLAAAQCVAYAETPRLQGDGLNISALKQAMDSANVTVDVVQQSRRNTRQAHFIAARAHDDDRGLAELRRRRDEACAGFVETGLVQGPSASQPS